MENKIYTKFKENIYKNDLICEGDKILFLCSLGKDSAVLAEMLSRLQTEIKFELITILFKIPVHVYDNKEDWVYLLDYWKEKGIRINVIDFSVFSHDWEKGLDIKDDIPCSECRKIRNKKIKEAIDKYKPDKIAAGFNLTDLQSYFTTMQLLSNYTLDAEKIKNERTAKRFTDLFPRFFAKVQSSSNEKVYWILPIIIFSDKSISDYIEEVKIPFLRTKCKFKDNVSRSIFKEFVSKLHISYQFEETYENLMHFFVNKNEVDIEGYVNDDWIK